MSVNLNCPRCGTSGYVYLTGPSYGPEQPTEFKCYRCDPYGWPFVRRSGDPQGDKLNQEALALSAQNARKSQ